MIWLGLKSWTWTVTSRNKFNNDVIPLSSAVIKTSTTVEQGIWNFIGNNLGWSHGFQLYCDSFFIPRERERDFSNGKTSTCMTCHNGNLYVSVRCWVHVGGSMGEAVLSVTWWRGHVLPMWALFHYILSTLGHTMRVVSDGLNLGRSLSNSSVFSFWN